MLSADDWVMSLEFCRNPPFWRPTISQEHAIEKLWPPKAMDFTFSPNVIWPKWSDDFWIILVQYTFRQYCGHSPSYVDRQKGTSPSFAQCKPWVQFWNLKPLHMCAKPDLGRQNGKWARWQMGMFSQRRRDDSRNRIFVFEGLGIGGREENCPKKLFLFVGNALLKVQILWSETILSLRVLLLSGRYEWQHLFHKGTKRMF